MSGFTIQLLRCGENNSTPKALAASADRRAGALRCIAIRRLHGLLVRRPIFSHSQSDGVLARGDGDAGLAMVLDGPRLRYAMVTLPLNGSVSSLCKQFMRRHRQKKSQSKETTDGMWGCGCGILNCLSFCQSIDGHQLAHCGSKSRVKCCGIEMPLFLSIKVKDNGQVCGGRCAGL